MSVIILTVSHVSHEHDREIGVFGTPKGAKRYAIRHRKISGYEPIIWASGSSEYTGLGVTRDGSAVYAWEKREVGE
jgi:hypothetical protein